MWLLIVVVKPHTQKIHIGLGIHKLKICFACANSFDFCCNPERQGGWGIWGPFSRRGAQVAGLAYVAVVISAPPSEAMLPLCMRLVSVLKAPSP